MADPSQRCCTFRRSAKIPTSFRAAFDTQRRCAAHDIRHREDAAGVLTPEPAASGVSLAKWSGGPVADLPPAESYWVIVDSKFYGYNEVAPAFVNQAFLGLFPGGIIPEGTILVVVR